MTKDKSKDHVIKYGLLDPYYLSPNENEWVVLDEFIFWSARYQKEIVVPQWFITDLASIPPAMRWLIGVNEKHRLAALAHDVGYGLHKDTNKLQWDKIFLDFCKMQEVPVWKREGMYYSVKLFGRKAFDRHRPYVFAPIEHRFWYVNQHPNIKLNIHSAPFK